MLVQVVDVWLAELVEAHKSVDAHDNATAAHTVCWPTGL